MTGAGPPTPQSTAHVGLPSPRFHSILFESPESSSRSPPAGSASVLHDLNLDQLIATALAGREEYDLEPFFTTPLRSVEDVRYRQEIAQELERLEVRRSIEAFAGEVHAARKHLDQVVKLSYRYQQASSFLDAAEQYCSGVGRLIEQFSRLSPQSRGLRAFQEYLESYRASTGFRSLLGESQLLRARLARVTYSLVLKGLRVTVREYAGEPDYSAQVLSTFDRFQRGAAKDYRVKFDRFPSMNHIEAGILELVANLYPDLFRQLREFPDRHRDFVDATIERFAREVQYYFAYQDYIENLRSAGLRLCYPDLSDVDQEVAAYQTFDLVLAHKLVQVHAEVVRNDFQLKGSERIIVVSGPNQGGKTTFARTFGQLHHLARLGLAVPGQAARLFLADALYTHFEREERLEDLRGKLQDELIRIHEILERATSRSIVIINESFTTTTLSDALFLGREVLNRIVQRGALCVYVTFIDELSTLGPETVSMVSTVAPDDPARRTFKVVRQRADGKAYALAIAGKYGLTYDGIRSLLNQ
jgi:DNA mismatch repair protein MutS